MLRIRVCEIRGKCPIYKVGDEIVIDAGKIPLDEQTPYVSMLCQPCSIMQSPWTRGQTL